MKSRLSDAEYAEVLSCIEGVYRCRALENFPRQVLTHLRKLIACDLSGYNEVNMVHKRMVVVFDPPQKGLEPLLETFGSYMHQHPVITYFDRTGDGQTLKISDFLTAREYHRLPLYNDFYRHLKAEDQISFAVRVDPGFMIGIAFNRDERTFTEKDRMRLNLIRPHIIQAYLHAAELAGHHEHRRDLQDALRKCGQGVIALHAAGTVAHATPGAFDCLARYLPVPEAAPPSLPESLSQWARGRDDAAAPFVVRHLHSKLIVRRVRSDDRTVLLLSEENGPGPPGGLNQFHLTPRELDVLKWITESKSNSEIATILGLTVGTVKIHVERILAKLGAENRTAAALLARSLSS